MSLTPSVEVWLRQDGGDAETATGIDVGCGLVFTDSVIGLSLDVRMRTLVVHQAEGFIERGMSLSFGWDPTPSSPLGLTARVAPCGAGRRWAAPMLSGTARWYGLGTRWPAPAAKSTPRWATGCRRAPADRKDVASARRPGDDQAARCGCWAAAHDVLSHVPGDGDHGVLVERGTLEPAQQIAAGHALPKTTTLYDRTADRVTVDKIERIVDLRGSRRGDLSRFSGDHAARLDRA